MPRQPSSRAIMAKAETSDLPPCQIFIDREGRWYHNGAEMIHRAFIRLFYQNMALDSHGRYVINWDGKQCQVDVEDTAFVVKRADYQDGDNVGDARFKLYLSDDTTEELNPDTLYVGKDNVPYCKVKDRTLPARFNRAAYYQLAEYIEEENGVFFLNLNGISYNVTIQ